MMDVNYLRLLADCMQNLPEKVKPCSGSLIKIIILLSVCKASFLDNINGTSGPPLPPFQ